jgi:RNA polymerase sigma-70 factor, ECF subfamily
MGTVHALRDSSPRGETAAVAPIPSNAALVKEAMEGHSWAYEALFRRHGRLAYGLSHRLLSGTGIDPDDLVQDAFVTAFCRLNTLREPEAFSSWLCSIVVRTASKRLRRHRLRVRFGLSRKEPVDMELLISEGAPPDVMVLLQQTYGILDRLRPDERIAFLLRRVEGLTITEIAERMDLSLSTVKRRLSAAEGRFEREVARRPLGANALDGPLRSAGTQRFNKTERRSHHDEPAI